MISQFFILSLRGDTIINKTFKQDIDIGKYNNTQEVFLGKVGIQNSYSEDKEKMIEPFFVSSYILE